jgi:hypothetical protein
MSWVWRGEKDVYPYSHLIGLDLRASLSKDQWVALVVDLMRSTMGEDVPVEKMRAEIIQRIDVLHAAGIVAGKLPKRYPRRGA